MDKPHRRGRRLVVAAVACVAIVALAAGIAYGTNESTSETIEACVKNQEGHVRIIGPGGACRNNETAVSWPGRGPAGYRALFAAPPSATVEVSAVGTGPLGFPVGDETETQVLRFALPPGTYHLGVTLGVFKNSGNAELLCYIRLPGNRFTAFMRVALGTDAGYTRLTTVHSDSLLADWPGGEGAVRCIQDGSRPGSPAGETPHVFYATVTATKLGSHAVALAP